MPVAPDIKKEYPDDWEEIRAEILRSASWTLPPGETDTAVQTAPRCEQCGKPHGETVWKGPDGRWLDTYWIEHPLGPNEAVWRDPAGDVIDQAPFAPDEEEQVDVVLTISHTCHDPRCDDRDHLEALCQFCHLSRDSQPEARERQRKIKSEIRGQVTLFDGSGCDAG